MALDDLPPSARERIERQRESGVAASLLSAPATAAIRGAGLAAAGEVFGCVVMTSGWANTGGCGVWASGYGVGAFGGGPGAFATGSGMFGTGWVSPVLTTEGGTGTAFGAYVRAVETAWHQAVHRMLLEAAALGAEGVVGVRIERRHLSGGAREYTALGTAVRVVDRSLVGRDADGRVWAADLSAEDVAAAVHAGRQPRGIAFGLAVSTKHEDQQMQLQRSSWSGQEVSGLSELLHASRDAARHRVAASAKRLGGGTLVVTALSTHEFDTACGDKETDLHAETTVQGTVLAPSPRAAFRTADRPGTARVLPVIPLSDLRTAR